MMAAYSLVALFETHTGLSQIKYILLKYIFMQKLN